MNHWVTSACFNQEVIVYDSKYNGELLPSLTHQLALIYRTMIEKEDDDRVLYVSVPNIQQQTGADDCGLFAIAFAIHAAAHGNCCPELEFNQAEMRSHLKKCFSKKTTFAFSYQRIPELIL